MWVKQKKHKIHIPGIHLFPHHSIIVEKLGCPGKFWTVAPNICGSSECNLLQDLNPAGNHFNIGGTKTQNMRDVKYFENTWINTYMFIIMETGNASCSKKVSVLELLYAQINIWHKNKGMVIQNRY
jgi:hypothetical protein